MKQDMRQNTQQNRAQDIPKNISFNAVQSIDQNIPGEIMREVEEILEERFQDFNKGRGFCHIYWYHKKELLRQKGYSWLSPADLNPNALFD